MQQYTRCLPHTCRREGGHVGHRRRRPVVQQYRRCRPHTCRREGGHVGQRGRQRRHRGPCLTVRLGCGRHPA